MMLRHKRPMARLLAAVLTCILTTPVLAAASTPAPVATAQPAPTWLVNQHRVTPVGPGITHTEITRFDALGWVRAQVLEADLTHPAVSVDLLFSGTVTGIETVSRAVTRTGAVAGINGDFYDIQGTRAPLGAAVQSGELLKSGHGGWETVAGVNGDGLGQIASLFLAGAVSLPDGEVPLAALNHYAVPYDGIGLYTPAWGAASRRGVADGAHPVRQVLVLDGLVHEVAEEVTNGPIPEGGFLLIGREAGAEALAHLQPGDPVTISYGPSQAFRFAVGGSPVLVKDGQVQPVETVGAHPRTAVGFSADGSRIFLVVVEGRQTHSRGMTQLELARFMQELGAHNALNLDGGGSSAMMARQPGAAPALAGSPAGGERSVANGIGLFVAPGSGEVTGIRVEGQSRVFPGLTRQLTAFAYDETYAPATAGGPITWSASAGTISESGLYRAAATGSGSITVTAAAGAVTGSRELQVLGALSRLETSPARLELQPGAAATFTVVGYDAEGRSAPVNPADLVVTATGSVTVAPNGAGLRVTAGEAGSGFVTIQAQGVQTYLPVAVGTITTVVSQFEEPSAWRGLSSNAETVGAALSFTAGVTGQAAALAYDFTVGNGTRAAYLTAAPGDLVLPGRPNVIGLNVHGDGSGTWLRAQLRDANGTIHTLNLADQVNWTGWRYIEQAIPTTVVYPVSLWRIYPVETNAARQYAGTLLFDDLTVKGSPGVTLPRVPVQADPIARPVDGWASHFRQLPELTAALVRKGQAHSFDEAGARIIVLDAGTGSFRTAGYSQLVDLQRLLAEAESDASVHQVIVAAALPTTALSDRLEAGLVERWLAEFRERSGKGVAYVAFAGAQAGVRRVEGVIHVTGRAQNPALLGISSGADWLRADVSPVRPVAGLEQWSGRQVIFGVPRPGKADLPLRVGDVTTDLANTLE